MASLEDLLEAARAKDSTAVLASDGHLEVTVDSATFDMGSISLPITDDKSHLVVLTEVLKALAEASGSGGGSVTVAWTDVTGKPVFSAVATSGSYEDLTDTPTIFSGSYTDLTSKPTLGTAAAQASTAFATAAQGAKADTAVQPAGLSGYAQTANVVPTTRTINTKALTANVSLTASDVSAAPAVVFSSTAPSSPSVGTLWGNTSA